MANRFARKTGNWNAADVWSDTAGGTAGAEFVPVAGDVAMANGFTVTVNVNATCSQVRNDTTGSATAGGFFDLANGVTLTANVYGGNTQPTGGGCVQFNLSTPNSAQVTGDCRTGTSGTVSMGVRNNGSGTLYVVGNSYGTEGGSSGGQGLFNNSTGTLDITGNLFSGASASYSNGGYNVSSGIFKVTGNVTGGTSISTTSYGIANSSTGTITISGNVIGGPGASSSASGNSGIYQSTAGTITVNGNIEASASSYAIYSSSTGIVAVTGPLKQVSVDIVPIYGRWRFRSSMVATYLENIDSDGIKRTLYTTNYGVGGLPTAGNVRQSTVYGPANELTGTLAVPPPGSVALGVPTDNTTGTAALTPTALLGADLITRLGTCSTVATTGAQIAALGV